MKKYIASFMVVCLLLMCSSAWADYWNEGHSGTEADPYVIDTNADLVALRDRVNAGTESADMYYKLTENLNISQITDWVYIGGTEARAFTGHFDGNGKAIQVNINRGASSASLFGHVNTEANTYAVKNLTVSGTVAGRWAAGVAMDLYSGIIDNCTFTGKLSRAVDWRGYDGNVGGIVEYMTGGKITNCTVTATMTGADRGTEYGGGIVGYMTGGSIENCKVEGTTLSTFNCAGGIAGYAKIANFEAIKNCTFSGTVNAGKSGSYSGGIVGYIEGGNLQNNHVTADTNASSSVSGKGYVGGIVGRIGEATVVESCDVSSLVTVSGGSQAIGGIVGLMNASTVRNNQSHATISGDVTNMGGVVGKLDASSYEINNNRYSSAEHSIGNNAQGVPSEEGCIRVGASIAITPDSLPEAVANSEYTVTLTTDSTTAVVWTLTNGTSLPEGLTLGRSTGIISGTPTTAGSYTFTVKASPLSGAPATKQFTLTVLGTRLTITTTSLPSGTAGTDYSATFVSNPAGASWSVESGTLPAGLTLNSSGVISGKPTTAGTTTSTFRVKATLGSQSVSKEFSITINGSGPAIRITTTSLPSGTVNASYSAILAADSSAVTWSIASGSLPAGLTLSNSGTISGTPTTAGTSTFTVRAVSGSVSATRELRITITGGPSLRITTMSLPAGTVNASYSAVLAVNSSAVTWSIASGSLPAGLTLSNSGTISGTPTAAGTSTFTVKATSGSNSAEKELSITINTPTGITITTEDVPNGTAGKTYTARLTSSASNATWSVSSGSLPDGLTLSARGLISGIPSEPGTYSFTVRASSGSASAEKAFSLIIEGTAITIMTTRLPSGVVGTEYSGALTSNPTDTVWSVSFGSLPPGLTLSSLGIISGTPTFDGTSTFTVSAASGSSRTTKNLSITINALAVTTSSLPSGAVGDTYSRLLTSNGSNVTWSVSSGHFPEGLTLNSQTGLISGTLTTLGTYNFTVQARNSYASASKSYTVNVRDTGSGGSSASSGGGGGCNSSLGIMAIAVLGFALRKKQ